MLIKRYLNFIFFTRSKSQASCSRKYNKSPQLSICKRLSILLSDQGKIALQPIFFYLGPENVSAYKTTDDKISRNIL